MTPAAASPIRLPDDPAILAAQNERDQVRSRAQTFFAQLARDMRAPHFGERTRDMYTSLLLRAQEAGLYDPTASFL